MWSLLTWPQCCDDHSVGLYSEYMIYHMGYQTGFHSTALVQLIIHKILQYVQLLNFCIGYSFLEYTLIPADA